MKVWHETREDLSAHETEPWTLTLRTDQLSPTDSANAIIDALAANAAAESRSIREVVGGGEHAVAAKVEPRFGLLNQGRTAMFITTRNTIVRRGLLPQAAKEAKMFGTMGPGAMIPAAVTVVAIAGLAIVVARWVRVRRR
ncbi:hypothetical protein [Streptomyces sp. bgisy031]|uniref:hypothetical protein n=1 Tax=Streptomyces sp. bgisy031 TaxID=3413772 RepID=UPI003D73483E